MNNKIILIGGDHYNGLALVRLFGKNGLDPYGIIVCPKQRRSFLDKSKYWKQTWIVDNESRIIEVLEEQLGSEAEKPVVIPWSDGAASLIDQNLGRLEEHFILPSIGHTPSLVYRLMDKNLQIGFAQDCGLQTARSVLADLTANGPLPDIPMPCIGKPAVSCEGNKKDIRKLSTTAELEGYLAELKAKGYQRILLQEYVTIDKEYDIEGFIDGGTWTYFVSEKVRTWPNIGGPTSYAFSVNDDALNHEVDKIMNHMREIGYSGLFDIEMFRTGDRYLLNEINWRNSAFCFAAIDSGVDYPLYWYDSVTGADFEIRRPERWGVYSMVELLDFHHVVSDRLSLRTWLVDYRKSHGRAYFDGDDNAPAFGKLLSSLRGRR